MSRSTSNPNPAVDFNGGEPRIVATLNGELTIFTPLLGNDRRELHTRVGAGESKRAVVSDVFARRSPQLGFYACDEAHNEQLQGSYLTALEVLAAQVFAPDRRDQRPVSTPRPEAGRRVHIAARPRERRARRVVRGGRAAPDDPDEPAPALAGDHWREIPNRNWRSPP